ncbi:SWIM zinc finger family protein [Acidovorax sp. NCPPB 4044]|uniref:SWIM zinc finger family protein n=1 Tax=Acidovorax sp. NCPPB 4044 TaxID=2940490 RepID=UPI002303CD63|nr:SWIM zinc finger family protein [Acidovorax sp. NCPPB 4044]MDA8522211.1 SWIM zinc finger family protein [Acidovorax sp. NCPPB 4044]
MPVLSPSWLSCLSDAALQRMSGSAVFGRGRTYAVSGAIETLEASAPRPGEQAALAAVVHGTQAYRVRVWIDADDELDGACNCPHAQEGNFCKHLVALSLAWRAEQGGEAAPSDPEAARKVTAAAKRAHTQAERREALHRFVGQQTARDLAERLWSWAERDSDLMADLKAWAAEQQAEDDPKALRGAITDLLKVRGDGLDWRESVAYARRAARVPAMLRPWLGRDPDALRDLCEHALRRLYKAAADADDSDGEIGGVMEDMMALLAAALRAAPPPAAWADRWFALMDEDPWGLWDESAILDAAGPTVCARHAERARRDWEEWLRSHPPAEPYTGRVRRMVVDRDTLRRSELRRRHLEGIRRQGDPRALRDAMVASLDEAWDFLELVALCEDQNWHREALQWAQAGASRHPRDQRLEDALLRCYERDGWDEEALAIHRRRMEQYPSPMAYAKVLEAAKRAGCDPAAYRAELFAWAESREAPGTPAVRKAASGSGSVAPERIVTVRVQWLIADGDLDAALALARKTGARCDPQVLETLAQQLPAGQDAQAVELLQRVFTHAMAVASSPYARPLELVRAMVARMPPDVRSRWLASLSAEYKPKRNFVAGLP